MQQHHTRQSHMRLQPHTNNIQVHPTPMLPGQPPTQQQKLTSPQAASTGGGGESSSIQAKQLNNMQQPSSSNAAPHMRDQAQNRANNPKQLPAATTTQHNQTAQMQKIRQQHQNLNYKTNANFNNNNNSSNTNHKQHYSSNMNMQHAQQNNTQQIHNMNSLQHHQQAALRNVPNVQNQQHQYNGLPMKIHVPPPTALKQILPANSTRPLNQQHQKIQYNQHGYNYNGNKPKYSNNNSNTTKPTTATFSTPKAILQNPDRITKPIKEAVNMPQKETPDSTKAINEEVVESSNNFENSTSNAVAITAQSPKEVPSTNAAESESLTIPTEATESNVEANKENVAEVNDGNNNSSSKVLCNDDSIAKNAKEKTPMCLVNELARFNKITHQYRLTGEKGPAHSKRFTVTLKLGNEEYTAEGFKIKKAQHAAASQALEKTAYKHPIPKAIRNHDDGKPRPYIMPTVELNALAMKLGQQTYYLYDPRQMPPPIGAGDMHEHADGNMPTQHYGNSRGLPLSHNGTAHLMPLPPQQRLITEAATYGHGSRRHFDAGFCGVPVPPPPPPTHMPNCQPQRPFGPPHRGGYPMMNRYQRYPMIPRPTAAPPPGMPHMHHPHYGMLATPYKITLIVGKQKFVGSGRTLQHAKHDAASRALQVLKSQQLEELKDDLDDSMDETDVKSPISQVHEAGIKRNLTVHFKIIREDGPAHMRNFITACIMGSLVTEGEGHGKKISKKRAAEKMLLEIKKLPPVTTPQKTPSKRSKTKTPSKHEGKDLIGNGEREVLPAKREKSAGKERAKKVQEKEKASENNEEECPITKLLQLMHRRKQKEPVFEYIAKSGNEKLKKREFIVEVTAQGFAARGTGVNKKIAKRNAAENLLHTLLESENSGSDDNDAIDLDETDDLDIMSNQSSPFTLKKPTKESVNVKSAKLLDDLNLPTVSTTGQVPGILILRQNRKPTIVNKKEATTTAMSTPTRPVKTISKRVEVDSNDARTVVAEKPKEKSKSTISSTATATVDADPNNKTEQESEAQSTTTPTNTATTINTSTAKEKSSSTHTTSTSSSSSGSVSGGPPSMMKQQLLYLANLLGFEVNFSDYPKGNHNEFLTIVALSTDPPQMCHGFGSNTNESQNDAARNALKILSDLGLNNAKSN